MAHCVNRSSVEFQQLAKQTNMNPIILAAKVSIWQEKNGLDNFPTVKDISPTAKASPELVNTMKEAGKQMGINMLTMEEYLKGNPEIEDTSPNGIADLTTKSIAIAFGKEDEAITEEI